MLIVIVIIGIMMTFTMNYSWQQIFKLRQKSVQETFLDSLNTFQTIALSSNYYEQKKYKNIILTLKKGNPITYIFSGWEYWNWQGWGWEWEWENQPFWLIDKENTLQIISEKIPKITEDSSSLSSLTLTYAPYKLACEIRRNWNEDGSIINSSNYPNLYFIAKSKKNTIACYQIQTATCKFKKIKCKGEL